MNNILERLAYINGDLRNKSKLNISNLNLNQKYILVENDCCKIDCSYSEIILYRIKSLKDFADVKAGTMGGFVQSYNNLSQDGDCWIYNNAKVYDKAFICDNAKIKNLAQVNGNSLIKDNAIIMDKTFVTGNSIVSENARVINESLINNSLVSGHTVYGDLCNVCGALWCEHLDIAYNSMRINNSHLIGDQFG